MVEWLRLVGRLSFFVESAELDYLAGQEGWLAPAPISQGFSKGFTNATNGYY
jgi:hypothetical protein